MMLENCELSGFADEIDPSISEQLALLGMPGVRFIEFRSGDGKKAAEYTADEALGLKKRLDEAGIAVSAIGSAIGKIEITTSCAGPPRGNGAA
jgi:hypothetical protein